MSLKACPCGCVPKVIYILDDGVGRYFAFGDCCDTWHVDFVAYNLSAEDRQLKAEMTWNAAPRNEDQRREE